MIINSRQNGNIKLVRRLHHKKNREQDKLFILEGNRALNEIINCGHSIHSLYYSDQIDDPENLKLLNSLKAIAETAYMVREPLMDYLSPANTSQKILALLPFLEWNVGDVFKKGMYFCAFYRISEPGNLGTIIRSARAFDCGGIFLADECVDPYNPRTVRASAGYILSMPVIHVKDIQALFKLTKENQIRTTVLSHKASNSFIPAPGKAMYLFGGETRFPAIESENTSMDEMKIPMNREVESLNLGTTASIVMQKVYENL